MIFLKKIKKKTAGTRNKKNVCILNFKKFKKLTITKKRNSGHTLSGKLSIRGKGGGSISRVRLIDFFNYKYNYNYKCNGIDRIRRSTGFFCLLKSINNIYCYKLAPHDFIINNTIRTTFFFKNLKENLGWTLPIGWIPTNTVIYNLEKYPGIGSIFIRAGGCFGKILKHYLETVLVSLPSKKKIILSKYCFANIGRVSNIFNKFIKLGKAGSSRKLNKRPKVKGEAMNAVDHPNGGKTHGGKPSKNPWGKIIK